MLITCVDYNRTLVYYCFMRTKDESKNESIFNATIQLINEIGLAETSMSKIAKKANVSASTIYVYFENKEDLLNKLYLNVKRRMSEAVFYHLDASIPLKELFEAYLRNFVVFTMENKDYFLFVEQFHNSPILNKISQDETMEMSEPLWRLFERGIEQQMLKQVDINLLVIFAIQPVMQVVKEHLNGTLTLDEATLNQVIQMSWDAVKA